MSKIKTIGLLLSLFFCGCVEQDYSITTKNQSSERLEEVTVSTSSSSFTFGVLADGKEKSFMNANTKFGNQPPTKLAISFTTQSGELFERENIEIPKSATTPKEINIVVSSDFNCTVSVQ